MLFRSAVCAYENGVPGVVVVGADGTENYVSGTLNGSSGATGGGETVVVVSIHVE